MKGSGRGKTTGIDAFEMDAPVICKFRKVKGKEWLPRRSTIKLVPSIPKHSSSCEGGPDRLSPPARVEVIPEHAFSETPYEEGPPLLPHAQRVLSFGDGGCLMGDIATWKESENV